MTTAILNVPATTETVVEHDPVAERAKFFFDLELMELTAVIPQAAPAGTAKY